MKQRAWIRLIIACILVILTWTTIAGCAPVGDIPVPEEEVPTPEEAVLNITAGEGYFYPDVITVEKGQEVTVFIANITETHHTFTINELAINAILTPGEQKQVSFRASEEGTFKFYCSEPGNRDAGMYGHLEIGEKTDTNE